ncbi:MAG: hypothetical protein COA85_10170 [Robiginitomaculum sp.]|nr:MAG: hypothetical protein COA85_10170 [Robiginitomaculum sp.]
MCQVRLVRIIVLFTQVYVFSTMLGIACVARAYAGAWPMEKGKGQSISTFTWQGGMHGFDRHGKARVDLSFQKYENAIFMEYGLTEKWTVVARPAVQNVRLRFEDVVDQAKGLGATELSLRRALPGWKKWVLSAQAGSFIPGSVENGFDKPLGQSGLDWEVRALAGRSLNMAGRHGFVDLQLAFRERSGGSGNEIRLDTTLGSQITRRMQVHLQSNIVVGLPSSRPDIRTVDSFKAQASAVWFFRRKTGVQLSLSRTLTGRNVVRDSGLTLGFWQRF